MQRNRLLLLTATGKSTQRPKGGLLMRSRTPIAISLFVPLAIAGAPAIAKDNAPKARLTLADVVKVSHSIERGDRGRSGERRGYRRNEENRHRGHRRGRGHSGHGNGHGYGHCNHHHPCDSPGG
jgi:hypothetical protein